MALDQRVREILVRSNELDPVVLEHRGVDAVGAHGLTLEDEIGDPADQILDGQACVESQLECAHGISVHRRHHEFVKYGKKVSEPTQKVLG